MAQLSSGMDPVVVRDLGRKLERAGTDTKNILIDIQRLSDRAGQLWKGSDSSAFQSTWSQLRPRVEALSSEISELGRTAIANAEEQEVASGNRDPESSKVACLFSGRQGETSTNEVTSQFLERLSRQMDVPDKLLDLVVEMVDGIADGTKQLKNFDDIGVVKGFLQKFTALLGGMSGGWDAARDLYENGGKNFFRHTVPAVLGPIMGLVGAKAGMDAGAVAGSIGGAIIGSLAGPGGTVAGVKIGGAVGAGFGAFLGGIKGGEIGNIIGKGAGTFLDAARQGKGIDLIEDVGEAAGKVVNEAADAVDNVKEAVSDIGRGIVSQIKVVRVPTLSFPF